MTLTDAHREDDQYNHETPLRKRARLGFVVLCEEEQGTQAELLDIQPNKYMLDRLREEESTRLARMRLIVDPREEVLVQEVEQEEGRKREAIDDGGYNGIAERDDNQLCHRGEESTPIRNTGRVLDLIHRAWRRSKQGDFDVVHYQRSNLKEAARRPGKTLKDYKSVY